MSDAAGPRAVVVGHGTFAASMVDAVGRISGKADQFRAVSNDGRDARGIEAAVQDALAASQATVVFTDLPAGSCTIAARRVAHGNPAITVVTGVSLPLLLAFAFGPAASANDVEAAAARGRAAIEVFPMRRAVSAG